MSRRFAAILALVVVLSGGCARKPTNASLEKVTFGMEPAQAGKVLGPPTVKETIPFGAQKAERWIYGEEPNQVELVFVGGNLLSKSGEFPEAKNP